MPELIGTRPVKVRVILELEGDAEALTDEIIRDEFNADTWSFEEMGRVSIQVVEIDHGY